LFVPSNKKKSPKRIFLNLLTLVFGPFFSLFVVFQQKEQNKVIIKRGVVHMLGHNIYTINKIPIELLGE
jgi:hypothetical protein